MQGILKVCTKKKKRFSMHCEIHLPTKWSKKISRSSGFCNLFDHFRISFSYTNFDTICVSHLKAFNAVPSKTDIISFKCWLEQHLSFKVRIKQGLKLNTAVEKKNFTTTIHEVELQSGNWKEVLAFSKIRNFIRTNQRLKKI